MGSEPTCDIFGKWSETFCLSNPRENEGTLWKVICSQRTETIKYPPKYILESIRIYYTTSISCPQCYEMHPLAPVVLCHHLCLYRQWSTGQKMENFLFAGDDVNKCRRELPFLHPLSIYFNPSCPTLSVKHPLLTSVRTGSCFRQTLSSSAQKGIT